MSNLNRRQFVAAAAAMACGAAMPCQWCMGAEAEQPKDDKPQSTTVDAGALSDYAKDGVWDKFAKSDKVLIVRHEGKLFAPSATCTHKKYTLRLKEGVIVCPGHGSRFTEMGVPIKGPAKVPLFRYGISKDDKGHVIVDKTKQFEEKKWDEEGAFLKV